MLLVRLKAETPFGASMRNAHTDEAKRLQAFSNVSSLYNMPMKATKATICTCSRCGHEWITRLNGKAPIRCAKCRSPYWDKPRQPKKESKPLDKTEDR